MSISRIGNYKEDVAERFVKEIGGPRHVVEVDETHQYTRKYGSSGPPIFFFRKRSATFSL